MKHRIKIEHDTNPTDMYFMLLNLLKKLNVPHKELDGGDGYMEIEYETPMKKHNLYKKIS